MTGTEAPRSPLLPPPLSDCGCLHDAGDVGGYIVDVLHEHGVHDPVLQGRLSDEARIAALDAADELIAAEAVLLRAVADGAT